MINKFIEVRPSVSGPYFVISLCAPQTIPIHQQAARRTSTRFHELGKQVEVFPVKVASVLRQEAERGGWLLTLWSGVEEWVSAFLLSAICAS